MVVAPPLTNASDAVALLTVRSAAPDLEATHLAVTAITWDVTAWPVLLWQADVILSLLGQITDDVPAALRSIGAAVAAS